MEDSGMGDIVGKTMRKPPANPIIGQARADEWDRKIDGIVVDIDAMEERQRIILTGLSEAKAFLELREVDAKHRAKWAQIRDIIIILLLALILAIISYNTSQLWDWG